MSDKKQNKLRILFQQYLRNTCTASELAGFWTLMNQVSEEDKVTEDIRSVWGQQNNLANREVPVNWDSIYKTIQTKAQNLERETVTISQNRRVVFRRWLAAASIIMLIGIGLGVYTLMKPTATQQPVAKTTPSDIQAPATNRAMITLADGSKVFLDSLQNGAVATQGNIQVVKLSNGQIA